MKYDLIVIGGGAGGCFAAIRLAELYKGARVILLEAARKPLSKVEISGGGRCNVTHACYDPEELIHFYPRGHAELLGPFYHFQPSDMIEWLAKEGVHVKEEPDGRVFPQSDSSKTIIDCFMRCFNRYHIQLRTSMRAIEWHYDTPAKTWTIRTQGGDILQSTFLLIASGSDQRTWAWLKSTGHHIIDPVPSLFTFQIRDKQLTALAGISMPDVQVHLPALRQSAEGPLLITHWGMSGPAILKLSAWGARELYGCGYVFDLHVNWLGQDKDDVSMWLKDMLAAHPKKQIVNLPTGRGPSRLWRYLCLRAGIDEQTHSAALIPKQFQSLLNILTRDIYRVTGKNTFKDEFVTAGGVDLRNLDMRRFESKIQPGLFLLGEVLNIDALTGGFNFQAAWTGAALAAEAIAGRLASPSS